MSSISLLAHEEEQSTIVDGYKTHLLEIGRQAVWSLSSAKNGNGVQQLRDNNVDTFWQSDGPQPHFVNIQFPKLMNVKQLSIYCDVRVDESYTPKLLSIRVGNNYHDLKELKRIEIEEPSGWVDIPLTMSATTNEENEEPAIVDDASGTHGCIKTNMIQLAILSNHQNGRDTHIRQIKVFGPATAPTSM